MHAWCIANRRLKILLNDRVRDGTFCSVKTKDQNVMSHVRLLEDSLCSLLFFSFSSSSRGEKQSFYFLFYFLSFLK